MISPERIIYFVLLTFLQLLSIKYLPLPIPGSIIPPSIPGKPVLLEFIKTAGGEKRKRTKSEGDSVTFDDIKLGQVYTVTVTSVKAIQLNVQLGKKVGTDRIRKCWSPIG